MMEQKPNSGSTSRQVTQMRHSTATPVPPDGVPQGLMSSPVFRRVPVTVRARLEEALLYRPEGLESLDAIADHFGLSGYRVSNAALKKYARRLEEFVRPMLASQIMSGLMGCLPDDQRQKLVDGSQVLLLSRVMQLLSDSPDEALPVADLAKLSTVLASLGKTTSSLQSRRRHPADSASGKAPRRDPPDASSLASSVRMLYGLDWSDEKESPAAPPESLPAQPRPPHEA